MKFHANYHEARRMAQNYANELQMPVGLERSTEYGSIVYRWGLIPKLPKNRSGWEARCEVVDPETWA